VALWGCSPNPSVSSPPPPSPQSPRPPDPCLITKDLGGSEDTVSVGLLEPVDRSRVYQPSNDSEQLLFRSISQNLVRLDCQGQLRPELAQSWSADTAVRVWNFTLNDTALAVLGSLGSADRVADSLRLRLQILPGTGIDSISAEGNRQLRVVLGGDSIPRVLADPALALVDSALLDRAEKGEIISLPARPGRPGIEFWLSSGEPRDMLDRGVDLLVTRNSELIEYAQSRTQFTTIPLPWTRTYLLVQPTPAEQLNRMSLDPQALARDVVHADARAAAIPPWLGEATTCPTPPSGPTTVRTSRIAYQLGDDVARALAERIVAVAPPGTSLRSLGLSPAELVSHLQQGLEVGYVVSVPSRPLIPCRYAGVLPSTARIEPLIETRAHAIVRNGVLPLTVDWDGTVRLAAP
jgi:hypothetical protein